jgi:hypothetical protein
MIKWFLYIVLLMISAPRLSYAKHTPDFHRGLLLKRSISVGENLSLQHDTIVTKGKQRQSEDDKRKIKEVARAKKLPKPEKIDIVNPAKPKPKRQRRPDGLERPPEIPRRND